MIYPIVIIGHPILKKVAEDIDRNYPDLNQLVSDMFETMYFSDGMGLAAPQIGKSIRIFVIDGQPLAESEPELDGFKKVFINAHITERNAERIPMSEGCLSIPNIREEVIRESRVKINYYDEKWEYHEEVYEGYKARIIQHEYDHLDGILFTDKLSPIRKRLLKGKLSAISKGNFDATYRTILPGERLG
ncbi:MAG TPA: peptide deformylase [Bacteroidales bacterium]|nr:peptide deformylase [Bacteroidales bacterium]